jgi:hypothetical protein
VEKEGPVRTGARMRMFAFILLDGDNLIGYGHKVGSKFGKLDMGISSDLYLGNNYSRFGIQNCRQKRI